MYGLLGWDKNIWSRYNWKSGIWGFKKNKTTEKIAFKVIQMKVLAMHITNKKYSFYIFMLRNLQNIFMEHYLYLIS